MLANGEELNLDTKRGEASDRLDAIFEKIAAESPEDRGERRQGLFDRLAAPLERKLVLFGTGQFGQLVLERLRLAGVEPCCFADNNPARWGQEIKGLEVLSPVAAVQRFATTATFVVTIFNGSAARQQLTEMGCQRVLPAPLLFWKYPERFMPDLGIDVPERIAEEESQIRQFSTLLADEQSRHELCDQISWRYWMEPSFLPLPQNSGEIYFPSDLIKGIDDEVFVDCGAFDGDSIRSFLSGGRNFRHLYALEPDGRNREMLTKSIAVLDEKLQKKVTVWPYAAGDVDDQVSFVATSDVASKVVATGTGLHLESRRLDSLDWQFTPTYIKMDIEGSEPDALAGCAGLLRKARPVLAICLYHRMEHLWTIPNLIHSLVPDHSLFLRRYAEDCWEQVCYAVPRHRLA
jgi:FkbM family methyltransferase